MNVKIDQVDCRPLKIQDLLTNTGIILYNIIPVLVHWYSYFTNTTIILIQY